MHKILSVEDLVAFCEAQNFAHFSAAESGYQICVQMPAEFAKSEVQDDTLFFADVLAFHTGDNMNRSHLTEDAAKKAMKGLAYKPVLANFCEIDGVRDFTSHDFDIDEDGNFTYYEKQIGCFTADKPYMKQDDEHEDRMNVFAKVAIPRDYTDAVDIIERKGGTDVSVELAVNELSWDAQTKTLMLNDVTVMGLTCLGTNPETGEPVKPGMENAHIELEDFSAEHNSVVFNSQIIDSIADAVAKRLSNNKAEQSVSFKEGGNRKLNKFEELLAKYGKTVEDIEFEYEGMTDEELESAFAAAFETQSETEDNSSSREDFDGEEGEEGSEEETTEQTEEQTEEGTEEEEIEEQTEEPSATETPQTQEETPVVTTPTYDPATDGNNGQSGQRKFTINGVNFEVSLSEIQFSLFELVNNTYGESDNDYYCVEVYEGSKTVVMSGLFSGRSYRQGYKVRNSVYSLVGDRVNVKAVYVTSDEEAELDRMRSNYEDISSKLSKYEAEPEKMKLLNSADYANIADQASFAELKKQENHFDLTIDEVKEKADGMLLAYAKSGKLHFAETPQPEKKKDFFAFARPETNTSFLDGLLNKKK